MFLLYPFWNAFTFAGMIYGAAVGDAIGLATRWMHPDECKFYYEKKDLNYSSILQDEHRVHWKQGDWTSNFDNMVGLRLNLFLILVLWNTNSTYGNHTIYMCKETIIISLRELACPLGIL